MNSKTKTSRPSTEHQNYEFSTKRQTLPSFNSIPSRRPNVQIQASNLFTDKNYNQTNLIGSPTHNALFATLNQIGNTNTANFYSRERGAGFLGFKRVNKNKQSTDKNLVSIGRNLELKKRELQADKLNNKVINLSPTHQRSVMPNT